MPYCARCRSEYKEGVQVCADCGEPLTDELPNTGEVEIDETRERTAVAFEARNELEAQSISHVLEQANIKHFVGATLAQSVYPMSIGHLDRIQIRVLERDLEAARAAIADTHPGADPENG